MKPLNYLQEAKNYISKSSGDPGVVTITTGIFSEVLKHADSAVKFILPPNGLIMDSNLQAIPERLRLPYQKIVLEYSSPKSDYSPVGVTAADQYWYSRRIVVATQDIDGDIDFYVIGYRDYDKAWLLLMYHLKISAVTALDLTGDKLTPYEIIPLNGIDRVSGWDRIGQAEVYGDVRALLEFLEALSCSNVKHETLKVRSFDRQRSVRAARKDNRYHVLTVDTQIKIVDECIVPSDDEVDERCRPREHVRRGHTRTYKSGLKIWIQSRTINEGIGGKIKKDYRVK